MTLPQQNTASARPTSFYYLMCQLDRVQYQNPNFYVFTFWRRFFKVKAYAAKVLRYFKLVSLYHFWASLNYNMYIEKTLKNIFNEIVILIH